jgi:hypothetical protein
MRSGDGDGGLVSTIFIPRPNSIPDFRFSRFQLISLFCVCRFDRFATGRTLFARALLTSGSFILDAPVNALMPLGGLGSQGRPLGQLLIRAAARADADELRAILASPGVQVDTADANGMTALHHASRAGDSAIASLLLAAGAQTSLISGTGPCTPLHLAARAIDRNHIGAAEVTLLLLHYGADPRERDYRQQTPLHVAAKYGCDGAARALLADPRCDGALLDADGKAALQWAQQLGHELIVRLLPNNGGPPMTTVKLLRRQILAERKAAEVAAAANGGKKAAGSSKKPAGKTKKAAGSHKPGR